MKVAVSSTGKDLDSGIDPRFGRANYFVVVDSDSGQVVNVIDNTSAQNAAHGAGINAAQTVADSGVRAVLTGRVGPKAFAVLQAAGIDIFLDVSGTVREAVERFKSGSLKSDGGPNSSVHQGMNMAPGRGGMGGGGMMGGGGRGMCGGGGRGMGGGGRGMGGGRR